VQGCSTLLDCAGGRTVKIDLVDTALEAVRAIWADKTNRPTDGQLVDLRTRRKHVTPGTGRSFGPFGGGGSVSYTDVQVRDWDFKNK
jgi:hypothetical protein